MNKLYNQLRGSMTPSQQQVSNQSLSLNSNAKNMFKNLMNASNPNEAISSIVNSNPQMQNVMSLFNSSGMTPKQFFYQFANQKGVNPDQFINSLIN